MRKEYGSGIKKHSYFRYHSLEPEKLKLSRSKVLVVFRDTFRKFNNVIVCIQISNLIVVRDENKGTMTSKYYEELKVYTL